MQRLEKTSPFKVGFLLSAGGAAFARSVELSGLPADKFHVVTDRECPALKKAHEMGIGCEKISFGSRSEMSEKASTAFLEAGCNVVILHFSRLVGPELFDSILTINVHPSLLPSFPGLDAVGDAAKSCSLFQGATLHLVDKGMDSGTILAQTIHAVPSSAKLSWRHSLAYRQKVLMTLVLIDWLKNGLIDLYYVGGDAFDRLTLPDGDLFCSPGFVARDKSICSSKLFDDLAVVGS